MSPRSMRGSGDLDRALGAWSRSAEHPHDVLAFRLAHFNNFGLAAGRDARVASA